MNRKILFGVGAALVLTIGFGAVLYQRNQAKHSRAGQTKVYLELLVAIFQNYYQACGDYPNPILGIEGVVEGSIQGCDLQKIPTEGRLEKVPKDAWGNPFFYRSENGIIQIGSYGADGVTGGQGKDKDLTLDLK